MTNQKLCRFVVAHTANAKYYISTYLTKVKYGKELLWSSINGVTVSRVRGEDLVTMGE